MDLPNSLGMRGKNELGSLAQDGPCDWVQMMALTKTPFLQTLVTTMCCGTTHKKPLVIEKRKHRQTQTLCSCSVQPPLHCR